MIAKSLGQILFFSHQLKDLHCAFAQLVFQPSTQPMQRGRRQVAPSFASTCRTRHRVFASALGFPLPVLVFFSIRSFQVASSSDDAAGSCNGIGNGVVVDERRLWQHRNVIVDVLQFPPAEAEYRREQAFVIDKWQPAGATT